MKPQTIKGWFQSIAIGAGILVSPQLMAEPTCELAGQYVVVETPEKLMVGICRNDVLGLGPNNPYHSDELLRVIEAMKGDSKFEAALVQLKIGSNYETAKRAVIEFGGMLVIEGEKADRQALEYVAKVMNDVDGVTRRLERKREQRRQEELAREKRNSTPIKLNGDLLKQMTESNKKSSEKITKSNCRVIPPSQLADLKILRIKFEDGEDALLLPYEGQMLADGRFVFKSPNSGKGLGGLQFGDNPPHERYLRFEGGKIFWGVLKEKTGTKSKYLEYEVKEVYESTAKDALGWARPMNAGETYDQCFYARVLHPEKAGLSKPERSSQ